MRSWGTGTEYHESVSWKDARFSTKFLFIVGMILIFVGVVVLMIDLSTGLKITGIGFEMVFLTPLTMSTHGLQFKIPFAIAIPLIASGYWLYTYLDIDFGVFMGAVLFTLFFGVGVFLLHLYNKEQGRINRCTKLVIGQIYDIQQQRLGSDIFWRNGDWDFGMGIDATNLSVAYSINGQWIVTSRELWETTSTDTLKQYLREGVQLRVNPDNPQEFVFAGSIATGVYKLMGWVFILTSFFCTVVLGSIYFLVMT